MKAERTVTTATLCPIIITGKTCSLLNALFDSATSTEVETRLHMFMRCFLAIRKKDMGNPSFQPKELLKASGRICLLKVVQNECLGSIIARMQHNDSSFEQTLHSFPTSKRPHYLLQLCKFVPFLSSDGMLRMGKVSKTQSCLCNLSTLSYCHIGIGLKNCTIEKTFGLGTHWIKYGI